MIAHWPRRRPGLVLAALALIVFGSLFPRGYMPIGDNSGRITVTLCSAAGKQRSITLDLGKKERPVRHSGSSNCWGVFTGYAALVAPPMLIPPVRTWRVVEPLSLITAPVLALFHFDPNAPPQAPPLLHRR